MTKKNIIFLSISLVLIILLGIGVSYSIWNASVSQDTNNTAYTECFDLSITNKENNISLDNAYPISNDKSKSLTPYTFTITNTCDITAQYNINLEVLNNSTLSSKFIDVMFEGNINLLSSYDSIDKVNTSSIESRKLITGILKSQESIRLWLDYNNTLEYLNNEIKSFKPKIVVVGKPINYTGNTVFNFDYTGSEQTFVAPVSGTYRVELWGAGGASYDDRYHGGNGGHTSGFINLNKGTNLYVYVGGTNIRKEGTEGPTDVAFDGGGSADNGGGSADNGDSWPGRYFCGGGRANYYDNTYYFAIGGSAGGLSSYTTKTGANTSVNLKPSTQISGNRFGIGGNHTTNGGGGGYYGGGSSSWTGGVGGSSFISGHNGCDAIKEESAENNIIHTGQSIHYSGLYFTNTLMIDGEGYRWTDKKEEQIGMPSHSDNSIIMGNSGNGYARITLVSID